MILENYSETLNYLHAMQQKKRFKSHNPARVCFARARTLSQVKYLRNKRSQNRPPPPPPTLTLLSLILRAEYLNSIAYCLKPEQFDL